MKTESNHQYATIFVVIVTAFVTSFSSSAMTLAIPSIGLEFDSKATLLGWLMSGYMICVAMFAVPFGRIADLTGRRRVFLIGIISFSVFNGLTFFAWNLAVVIFLRVMQGFTAAMVFSTNNPILIDAFPPEKRGKVLGYSVTAIYAGLSTGPVIGGLINHYLGWRYIFLFTVAVGLFAIVVALTKLPKTPSTKLPNASSAKLPETSSTKLPEASLTKLPEATSDHVEKIKGAFNVTGNLMYISAIFCIMYGFTLFGESTIAKVLIPIGIAIGVLFVLHEQRTEKPIVKMSLFKGNMSFLLSNMAALFNYGATFAVGYLMSLYLQLILGYTSSTAGFILITQPLVMALVSPWAGRASDKVSPFKLASAGMGLCAATLLSYTFLGIDGHVAHIIINLTVIGVGFGLFSSPNTNAVMSCVGKEDYGVASSILTTMRTLGHTSSMAIITLIMSAHLGTLTLTQATPEQLVTTMHTCFIVFSAICLVGVFISLQRKTKHLERDRQI